MEESKLDFFPDEQSDSTALLYLALKPSRERNNTTRFAELL